MHTKTCFSNLGRFFTVGALFALVFGIIALFGSTAYADTDSTSGSSIANINVTSPSGGDALRGSVNIIWTDSSGAAPYEIFYSSDFSTYSNLVSGASGSPYLFDTTSLIDGTYKIRVVNNKKEEGTSGQFSVDNTNPVSIYSIDPIFPDGKNGWYVTNPIVTLTCTDNLSGCQSISWGVDGVDTPNQVTGASTTFTLSDGIKDVVWRATDVAGNVEDLNGPNQVKIDTLSPTVSVTSTSADGYYNELDEINITLTFSEPVSSEDDLIVTLNTGGECTIPAFSDKSVVACTYVVSSGENTSSLSVSSITPVSGVVEDIAGNDASLIPTSNISDTSNIVIDTVYPDPFTTGDVTPVGGSVVLPWWNSTNTGINIVVPINNDSSLLGGTLQLQAKAGTNDWSDIRPLDTISVIDTNLTIFASESDLEGIVGFSEGVDLYFRAVISDIAGNVTYGDPSATSLIVDQTSPLVDAGSDKEVNTQTLQDATTSDPSPASDIATWSWTQQSGPGTITFSSSNTEDTEISADVDGVYVVRLTVVDNAGNSSYDEMTFVWDTTAPVLTEITPVNTPTNNSSPVWKFNVDNVSWLLSGGNIKYYGSCQLGDLNVAVAGDNTVTFGPLADGIYDDCSIDVTDAAGNTSSILDVAPFEIDTISAVVTDITTYDDNGNGKIDRVALIFDDPVDDSTFMPDYFSIDGIKASEFGADRRIDDNKMFLIFENEVDGTEQKTVIYAGSATDLAGNTIDSFSMMAVDMARPVLVSAKTTSITSIDAVFSEDLNGTTVNGSGSEFSVSGFTVASATESAPGVVTLIVNTIPTDATPDVTYSGADSTIKDLSGNDAITPKTVVAIDGVAPVLTSVTIESDNDSDVLSPEWAKVGDTVTLRFTSSESLATPVVTIDGMNAIVSGGANMWTATYTFVGGEDEGVVPFTIDFEDLATPEANKGAQVTSTTDSSEVFVDQTSPLVDAGSDKEVNTQTLQDATTSDPSPASDIATWSWTQQSGPGTITFSSSNTEDTEISADVDGVYVVRLTVVDNAGNSSYDEMTFVWDTTAPVVMTSVPFDGAMEVSANNGTANIVFDDEGNIVFVDATKIMLVDDSTENSYMSGASISGGDGNSKTLNINYSTLENETRYRINVQPGAVRDVAGNVLSTNFIAYFTTSAAPDTTAPSAPVIETSANTVDADFYVISGNVSDDGGQRVVNLYNGSSLVGSIIVPSGQTYWSVNVPLNQNTDNVFTAKAVDQVGNISGVSNSVIITEADPVAIIPTIELSGDPIVSSYTVSEAEARFASGLQFNTTNADSVTVNGVSVAPGSAIVAASKADATTLGLHVYTIIVTSSTGNVASKTVAYQVVEDPVQDTVAPVIVLLGSNPQTLTVGDSYVELGATALDNIDGDISSSIVIDASNVDMSSAGTYTVTYNVSDSSGNSAVEQTRTVVVKEKFDDTASLAVTGIEAIKTYAIADDTYENGWSWRYKITVPTDETQFQMKFSDFTSGTNVINAGGNIRLYTAQASANSTSATAVTITASNTYSATITLDSDLDPSQPGRQIEVIVEMKVPEGSAGGSYSAQYGVKSL